MNLYKELWSRIGGRKWTWITRDLRQKYPLPWQLGLATVMIIIGHYCWGIGLLIFGAGVLLGIIMGHFWWGTKYIPDQRGE